MGTSFKDYFEFSSRCKRQEYVIVPSKEAMYADLREAEIALFLKMPYTLKLRRI